MEVADRACNALCSSRASRASRVTLQRAARLWRDCGASVPIREPPPQGAEAHVLERGYGITVAFRCSWTGS